MSEAVLAFEAVRRQIAAANLLEMNKTLIYDDVGIAIMAHALDLCAKQLALEAHKINASSSVNFITTRLESTPLSKQLDWNGTGKGFVQKPDAVFQILYTTPAGVQKELLVYYESDAGDKGNNKDRKQAARNVFQSTCGCHEVNGEMPAVTVRGNVFSGPVVDAHLRAAVDGIESKVQRQAQDALDFLHQLTVAHAWVCCQICLMLTHRGVCVDLATPPGRRKRFDLHFFVGHIRFPHPARMAVFLPPGVEVELGYVPYDVSGAAAVQCLCVERVDRSLISSVVLAQMLVATSAVALRPLLHGMLSVQDLWHVLGACAQHAAVPYPAAVLRVTDGRAEWSRSGRRVLGLPGPGLARAAAAGAAAAAQPAAFIVCEYPAPTGATLTASWILARAGPRVRGLIQSCFDTLPAHTPVRGSHHAQLRSQSWASLA